GKSGQHSVQLRSVDLLEHVGQVLEDGVDFGGDVLGLDHLTRDQPVGAGVARIEQVDVLRAEYGGGLDLGADVGRNVADLIRVDVQLQLDGVVAALDGADHT